MSPATPALPGPLFFALFCLAAGVVSYLVHRWSVLSGLVAAASSLALGWISLRQTSGESLELFGRVWVLYRPFVLLGREWAFTAANLSVLTFVLFCCGLTFLLALPASQGWSFYPFGLVVLRGIAELAGVTTPAIDRVLLWAQARLGREYLTGGKLGGADLPATRAPQVYGLQTLAQLLS